ncbi:homoserine kinase [Helicobacter sp. MIT 99-5507]|uniref:homoserine kinase n=1 Tax=Helicobacter sp. MIT 99-5507 TaxID=152489 RepID=UPI000E1E86BB|nr:homoserine kinase [Helicobacter sp. MIT 99-5507]RDU57598.1 homoserine kinase [Helicobacter sp. MIT 99-5507]
MIVRVPATSANLGPGFDTLGLSLSLYNRFEISPSIVQSIKIDGEGSNIPKLLKDNSFIKIFKEIYYELGGDVKDFTFHLKNEIPISRGLGSSSAVVVGAIISAYEILKVSYTRDLILSKAIKYEKHPDNITPAVNGGFNIAMIKNSKVFYIRHKIPNDIKAVVVIPNKAISTRYSRRALPKQYSLNDAVFNISRSSMLAGIFLSKRWNLLKIAGEDKIHQDKRMALLPALFAVRKEALKRGALMSVLSGSGSTFLNICYRDDAPNLAKSLSNKFREFRVLELEFDNIGFNIE